MSKPVLLVENDEDDIFFMQRAWKQAQMVNPLQVVRDGQQALDYLDGVGKYADRMEYPLPCLVLLDWKLPYLMGLEVLKCIRSHPHFKTLLVVVLTSSGQFSDIDRAYRLGANAYLEKPTNERKLLDLVNLIKAFWLNAIRLPPGQF